MPFTVIDCKVTTNLIEITFSDTIASEEDVAASQSGKNPAVLAPGTPWEGVPSSVFSTWKLPGGGWLWPVTPSAAFKNALAAATTDEEKKAIERLRGHLENSVLNPYNYIISSPPSYDFKADICSGSGTTLKTLAGEAPAASAWAPKTPPPTTLNASWAWVAVDGSRTKVTINFLPAISPAKALPTAPEFPPDGLVTLIVKNIRGVTESGDEYPELEGGMALIVRRVAGATPLISRVTRDFEDAISYPLLTEEVGYPPSVTRPGGGGGGGGFGGGRGGNGGHSLGQVASTAIGEVLGWKTNALDAKGFVGALTQSFSLTEIEGRIESKWNPKTYTVQTDLAGGITGAQASLYTRAQVAQDKCLPLLDGLYALDPRADPEYVKALREIAKSQITEIVKQFGVVPPSILRVNTYFHILLGVERQNLKPEFRATVETNPDAIEGTLGNIRKIYGIWFQKDGRDNPLSNSIEDEQNITNFRVISDYMTSLLLTWLGNFEYFKLTMGKAPAFLGTQLILIGRQFNVIAETVNEVRFTLDSVFIGPNERQQLLLVFPDGYEIPSMYLEDVLVEIEKTVCEEGPRLIKDGGRIALYNNVLPVIQTLINMIEGARNPCNIRELPDGFRTARVRHSLDDLRDQLTYLFSLAQQVGTQVPQPWQQ
jgi:hypothetical protein